MTDVLGYLQSKNLNLKSAGPNEVHTACWWHQEEDGRRGRLYINVDAMAEVPGCYLCFVCGAKGNLVTLKQHFGDSVSEAEVDTLARYEVMQESARFYHQNLADYEEALLYLKSAERGLTCQTIVDHQLGYAGEEVSLYDHLRENGFQRADILATGLIVDRDGHMIEALRNMVTIPYMVAGSVVTIRGRTWPYDPDDKKPKYKTLAGTKARLFNSDSTWTADEVIACEGELDCLVMEQLGYAAVGVPGANSWQDVWDGYFTACRRVYLIFDRDPAGEAGARKLLERFGSKARRIHLSEEGTKIDPTDWVAAGHTAGDMALLIKAVNQSGGILVTVEDAVTEFAGLQGREGLKFGDELLDLAVSPGLMGAQVMVVLGKTGVGKTIHLLNLMHRMSMVKGQENLKFLFVSLEQTRGEWFDRARRIHRFYNLEATDQDAVTFWKDRLLISDQNRVSSKEVRQAVDDFTYRMNGPPDVILIDYLGYWARSFKGEEYSRLSDAVMELKALAKDLRIPIIAPHQVNRISKDGEEFGTDAGRGSGVIEETADMLFGLWSPDNHASTDQDERSGVVKMRILKSRQGGRGQLVQYQFAPLTLTLVPARDPLAVQARAELEYAGKFHRDTWEQAIYRHRTGFKGEMKHVPPIPRAML